MKKNLIILVVATTIFASCGTYTGSGAANGAYFGSLLGSAIGGIHNGYHGSNVGTILGMAGGAIVGAAVGSAADKQRTEDLYQYRAEKERLAANREARRNTYGSSKSAVPDLRIEEQNNDDSGFNENNNADDRVDIDFGNGNDNEYSYQDLNSKDAKLQIRNARFEDSNGNNVLSRGEQCDIVFEIYNSGSAVAYNVEPTVREVTGNKHILVSPSILVESLAAHKGVRYTARVVADRLLKNGTAKFAVSVLMNKQEVAQPIYFTVKTQK